MAKWRKGQSGNPNGRKVGTPNKVTRVFKDAVLNVFEEGGGEKWLLRWARRNPTEYFKIAARLIPHEVTAAGNTLPIPEEMSNLEIARRVAFILHMAERELDEAKNKPEGQDPKA